MITLNDTIQELHRKMAAGEITALDILNTAREQEKKSGPRINAYTVQADGEALTAQAQACCATEGMELAGIPYAVLDTICVENLPLTCASRILEGFIPGYDAGAVDRIQKQGGMLTGKLNCSEFGMDPGSCNSIFSKTKNPWNPEHPEQTVSGAAAAVASGQVWFSLGGDGTGEIRTDAAACGLVAIKPTFPTVSKHGLVAVVPSMEQIGIAARHLEDCQKAWRVIVGRDSMDSTTVQHPRLDGRDETDPARWTVGIPTAYLEAGDKHSREAVALTAERLRQAGVEVKECSVDNLQDAAMAAYVLQCAEASSSLARFDGVRYGYRDPHAADVLTMYLKTRSEGLSEATKKKIMAGTFFLSVAGYTQYYEQAVRLRTRVAQGLNQVFSQVDFLLTPVAADPTADSLHRYWPACANLAGLPALTFPGNLADGVPVGVQLIGKAYHEPELFSLADKGIRKIDWELAVSDDQQSGGDRG